MNSFRSADTEKHLTKINRRPELRGRALKMNAFGCVDRPAASPAITVKLAQGTRSRAFGLCPTSRQKRGNKFRCSELASDWLTKL